MLSGMALKVYHGGASPSGSYDLYKALQALGVPVENISRVILEVGDVSHEITTVSRMQTLHEGSNTGEMKAGGERTGEDPIDQEIWPLVPTP